MNHPYLAVGQEVVFVGHDKKTHTGKIVTIYGVDAAQIALDDGSVAIADCSEDKKPGTFHFEQASPKEESAKSEATNKHKKE